MPSDPFGRCLPARTCGESDDTVWPAANGRCTPSATPRGTQALRPHQPRRALWNSGPDLLAPSLGRERTFRDASHGKVSNDALASGGSAAASHAALGDLGPHATHFPLSPSKCCPSNATAAHLSASPRLPRAQRTQSAAREALQRRAYERAAVGCSGLLDGLIADMPQVTVRDERYT